MVRRYLLYKGYDVKHVMNFTDVDDKIIKRAQETGDDPFAVSQRYVDEFHRHIAELRVLPATVYARVSDTIPEIVEMVQALQESRYAYPTDGDVYFRVRQDEDYGKLSRRKLDDVLTGTRVEVGESKEDPNDFALWKGQKPGEPAWDSPWGPGRPGWHIECSAMALKHLGEQIDIHGGGNDLIFPHHENEIAQTECYTGKSFARYWMHNGMLQLSGEKMSKSLGNLVTVDEFLAEHEADVMRLLIVSSHYRKPLAFNATVIEDNERALARLRSALRPGAGRADGRRVGLSVRAGYGHQPGARCRRGRTALRRSAGYADRAGRRAGAATGHCRRAGRASSALYRLAAGTAHQAARRQTIRPGRRGAQPPDRPGCHRRRHARGQHLAHRALNDER